MAENNYSIKIGTKSYNLVSDDKYLEAYKRGFESDMVHLYKSLINESDIIIDVGANVGCSTLLFSEIAEFVYSFEPCPSTYFYLDKNIKINKISNVSLHNLGLGYEDLTSTITFSPNNRSGGFISNQTKVDHGHLTEKIYIRPLDNFVMEHGIKRINFIKIDTEGFEPFVLQGSKQLISRHNPVVVMELNHWCLNAFQRISIPEYFDLLISIFDNVYAIDGNTYLDLKDKNERYAIMYSHIINFKYPNILGFFHQDQVARFMKSFIHKPI